MHMDYVAQQLQTNQRPDSKPPAQDEGTCAASDQKRCSTDSLYKTL